MCGKGTFLEIQSQLSIVMHSKMIPLFMLIVVDGNPKYVLAVASMIFNFKCNTAYRSWMLTPVIPIQRHYTV